MPNIVNLAAAKILRGNDTRVYINPTINSDGSVTLTAGARSAGGGLLDSVAHANAKDLGYLAEDGVQFGTTPNFEDLPVLQSNESIQFGMIGRVSSIKFKGLQIRDYAIWAKIIPATALLSATGLTGISDQLDQTVTPFSLVAIAPTPNDQTKYVYLVGYSGYHQGPFNVTFSKKWNMTDIDMKLLDAGRSDGKTWAIFEQT